MVEEISSLISTVGFPIAMCVIMLTQFRKGQDEMRDAIANNTLVMQKLIDTMAKNNPVDNQAKDYDLIHNKEE